MYISICVPTAQLLPAESRILSVFSKRGFSTDSKRSLPNYFAWTNKTGIGDMLRKILVKPPPHPAPLKPLSILAIRATTLWHNLSSKQIQ